MAQVGAATASLLLVEGKDDERVTEELCERAGIVRTFDIEIAGNDIEVLKRVSVEARVSGRSAFGVVIDTNSNFRSRWQSLTDRFSSAAISLPTTADPNGTVVPPTTSKQPRVGVWLMPDNQSSGELEDFVASLIPTSDVVWPMAQRYVNSLPVAEQPTKPSRAQVHAWLAVRTEGRPMGLSIKSGAFDVHSAAADAYLQWLQRLFAP